MISFLQYAKEDYYNRAIQRYVTLEIFIKSIMLIKNMYFTKLFHNDMIFTREEENENWYSWIRSHFCCS
mgnify:CR=1 FL=1